MTRRDAPAPDTSIPSIQDYSDLATTYDAKRYVEEVDTAHEARRRSVLLSILPSQVDLAADVACGTGRGIGILRTVARRVIGVDGTLAMLRIAGGKFGGAPSVAQSNAAQLPFRDGTFDLLISLNFLHLFQTVDEKRAFVTEMGRVVKPGGVVVAEFDNALQGVVLGAARKYLGKDIGYDWPWQIRQCFAPDTFSDLELFGANLPFVWRVPVLRRLDQYTKQFPVNLLTSRIFARATRKS
jgi:ubiquinone/menaquinone biosynthesis C-methylase UbiE